MTKEINSDSDARTVNNAMRHKYRVLSEKEKARMTAFKDAGAAFVKLIWDVDPEARLSRELEFSQQKIEEAVMLAVKHITR